MELKKTKRLYRIITCICISFLVLGSTITVDMVKQNNHQTIEQFEESVDTLKSTIMNRVTHNIEILDGVSIVLGELEITNLEELLPVLKDINDRNSFYRMGLIHENGIGDLVDMDGSIHRSVDFSDRYLFENAKEKDWFVTVPEKDIYRDQYLYYYAVPIRVKEDFSGVLIAGAKAKNFAEMIDAPIFSGGGYSNIIDKDGNYVLRSHKETNGLNIFASGSYNEQDKAALLQDFQAQRQNSMKVQLHGESVWISYTPLGINDWVLFSLIQEDEIVGNYQTILWIVILIALAMIIFLILFYIVHRISVKNEKRLEELAYQDPLLHIQNFEKFNLELNARMKTQPFRKFAFWFGDIDSFKVFNETFGYEHGNELLKEFAHYLEQRKQIEQVFCRESADYFTGIYYYEDKKELLNWYEDLSKWLEGYGHRHHEVFQLIFKIGFYPVTSQQDLMNLNQMYNRAKIAQQSIKRSKDVNYAFYSDEIWQMTVRENEIAVHMKEALEAGEFKVYVQPKTDVQNDNRIIGGEALVRWVNQEGTIIPPIDFIPLFEKNGFIIALDRYMFEQVCAWLSRYLDEGNRPVRIAVNVSRLGIFQEDFISYYTQRKEMYHIPDHLIELEFTESLALEDHVLLRKRVQELQAHGFICSLDDFGAGYSSLNTLKELPIQVLKLDILFFKKEADLQKAKIIVQNIIHLAHQLSIRVVAEGIEEPQQVEFLKRCQCDIVQGYVFERPIPLSAFEALLKKNPSGNWGRGYQKREEKEEVREISC